MSKKHKNRYQAYITNPPKLSDDQVLFMRRTARADISKHAAYFGRYFDIDPAVAGKALGGSTFAHLNDIEAPVVKVHAKVDAKAKTRALYMEGKSYNQIHKELGVAKSSISIWCRDLSIARLKEQAEERAAKRALEGIKKIPAKRTRIMTDQRRLKDDQVILMRREIRQNKVISFSKYIRMFNVSYTTIRQAVYGMTYKNLDHEEPPITEKFPYANMASIRKHPEVEALIPVMLEMRRSDPAQWTYAALKGWLKTHHNVTYSIYGVAYLLCSKDPSIREVRAVRERKITPAKALIPEMIDLRKRDPHIWTYGELAIWLSARTDRRYRATHVKALIIKHDPSMAEIVDKKLPKIRKPQPPKPPRPSRRKDLHTCECVICEKKFQSKLPEMEICSAACRNILREYGEYDKELES